MAVKTSHAGIRPFKSNVDNTINPNSPELASVKDREREWSIRKPPNIVDINKVKNLIIYAIRESMAPNNADMRKIIRERSPFS